MKLHIYINFGLLHLLVQKTKLSIQLQSKLWSTSVQTLVYFGPNFIIRPKFSFVFYEVELCIYEVRKPKSIFMNLALSKLCSYQTVEILSQAKINFNTILGYTGIPRYLESEFKVKLDIFPKVWILNQSSYRVSGYHNMKYYMFQYLDWLCLDIELGLKSGLQRGK